MAFGVIELLLLIFVLLVVPAVIGGAAMSKNSSGRSGSRVDWNKVIFVFLGLPVLLIVALVGSLFVIRSSSFEHAQVEQQRLESEQQLAAIADQVRAQKLGNLHEEVHSSEGAIEGDAGSENHEATEVAPPQAHVEVYEAPVVTVHHSNRMTVLALGALGLIVIGSFALLVWIGRKSPALAFCCFFGLVTLGLIGGYSSTMVKTSPQSARASVSSHETVSAQPVIATGSQGLIPVNEEGEAEDENAPLEVREITHHYQGNKTRTRTTSEIPEWVQEANGQNLVRPKQGEIVLISKRYSSLDEAKTELRPIANSLIHDELVKSYPAMRQTTQSFENFLNDSILAQECEITWPFEVRDFSGEVKQLAWKLDISEPTKKQLYAQWQAGARQERLAILGTGLGALTLLFGAGAVVTRRRSQKRVS